MLSLTVQFIYRVERNIKRTTSFPTVPGYFLILANTKRQYSCVRACQRLQIGNVAWEEGKEEEEQVEGKGSKASQQYVPSRTVLAVNGHSATTAR